MPSATVSTGLLVAGIATSVVGTGVAVYGQMQAANAASEAAKYNAQIAQNNQMLANQEAVDAKSRGDIMAQEKANQTAGVLGRQKASLAANGVDVNTGSSVDLESDTMAAGQLDELTIQNNAARESAGYTNQSVNYSNQAAMDEASSQQAETAGALAAGSTLLKGAGSVAGSWYNFNYGSRQSNPGYGVSGGL